MGQAGRPGADPGGIARLETWKFFGVGFLAVKFVACDGALRKCFTSEVRYDRVRYAMAKTDSKSHSFRLKTAVSEALGRLAGRWGITQTAVLEKVVVEAERQSLEVPIVVDRRQEAADRLRGIGGGDGNRIG